MATLQRVRVTITGVGGAPAYSSMCWPVTVTAQDAADAMSDLWSMFDNIMVNDVSWAIDPTVLSFNSLTGEFIGATAVSAATSSGAATTEMMPPANQVLVQWGTSFYVAGRRLRGRTYIPYLGDDQNVDGLVSSATRTAYATDLPAWLAAQAEPPVVYSRTHFEFGDITDVDVWNQFAVLRSRRD